MKIGIDGVLLGAWARLEPSSFILDVGTGTGLIALMAAQRSCAEIDAIDIDSDAAAEASQNFMNSPWSDRLNAHCCALQEYQSSIRYNHIVSNPPFFNKSLTSKDSKRTIARHTQVLSFKDLIEKSNQLLDDKGKISLILPADAANEVENISSQEDLFLSRKFHVRPRTSKPANRILFEFSKEKIECQEGEIILRDDHTNSYAEQFRKLTADFYKQLK